MERDVDQSVNFSADRNFLKTSKLRKWSIDQGNLMSEIARAHRLGLYLKSKDRTIAEYREKVGHHELQAAHAEEERRLLQGQLWRQKLEFREAHQQSLTEMEEDGNSRVLPPIRSRDESSSRIRTLFWNYQAEYRNCKMK